MRTTDPLEVFQKQNGPFNQFMLRSRAKITDEVCRGCRRQHSPATLLSSPCFKILRFRKIAERMLFTFPLSVERG